MFVSVMLNLLHKKDASSFAQRDVTPLLLFPQESWVKASLAPFSFVTKPGQTKASCSSPNNESVGEQGYITSFILLGKARGGQLLFFFFPKIMLEKEIHISGQCYFCLRFSQRKDAELHLMLNGSQRRQLDGILGVAIFLHEVTSVSNS